MGPPTTRRPTTRHKGRHFLCYWGAPRGGGGVFLYSYPKQGPGDLVGGGLVGKKQPPYDGTPNFPQFSD